MMNLHYHLIDLIFDSMRINFNILVRIIKEFIFEDEVNINKELNFILLIAADIVVEIKNEEVCILSHENESYKIHISSSEPLANIFVTSAIYSPDYGKQALGKKIVFKSCSNKLKWSLKIV